MRIGIFGGTFDPCHIGHIKALKAFMEAFAPMKVFVIPTGTPPHKALSITADADRIEMLRLALEKTGAELSLYEIEKGGKSYTVQTLQHFRELYPDAELVLYTGSDMFLTLKTWYHADEIMRLARIAVLTRTGDDVALLEAEKAYLERDFGARCTIVPFEPVEVSSTEIRERLRRGEDVSALLSDGVYEYIIKNKVYSCEKYDIERYKKFLQRFLKPSRYEHSLGVMQTAVDLARINGADVEKARVAGLLHDVTKNIDEDGQWEIVRRYNIPNKGRENTPAPFLHAMTAPYVLRDEFGITDEEILRAVAKHTVGGKGMTLLDKIVYVADFVEPTRDYENVAYYRELAYKDLDRALFECMEWTIIDKIKNGKYLNTDTVDMYNEYIAEKKG